VETGGHTLAWSWEYHQAVGLWLVFVSALFLEHVVSRHAMQTTELREVVVRLKPEPRGASTAQQKREMSIM